MNVYNKEILAAPKCGSRYLDETWPNRKMLEPGSKIGSSNWIEIVGREYVELFDMENNPITSNVKWIIIREPIEFFESAIHTEFVGGWDREDIFLDEVSLLNNIIKQESQSHWHRQLFKRIYLFGLSLPNPPTIVMLKDLTNFLSSEMEIKELPSWSETKYNFSERPFWVSKSDVVMYLNKRYPAQWDTMQRLLKTDELFWHKMKTEFPIWKEL